MMRQLNRWTGALALAMGLLFGSSAVKAAAPAPKAEKPALVLRVAALDTLINDVFHLARVIGREDEVKQAEELLKNFTGPNGIEGLNTKKPWGIYGKIGPNGIDSEGVILLPIANQKGFLDFLEKLKQKPEEKNGLYTLNVDSSPFPLFFRFHNGYLWGTLRDENSIAIEKLPDPAQLLAPEKTGALSLTFDFSALPEEIRKMALQQIETTIKEEKEKSVENENEAKKKGRLAGVEMAGKLMSRILTEGGETGFKIDLDRTAEEFTLEMTFAGKEGSPLAKDLAEMGERKGLVANLAGADSAYCLGLNVKLPQSFSDVLVLGFKEGFKDGLAKQNDPKQKETAQKIHDIILPILQQGVYDLGADFRGPAANGKYSVVGAVAVPGARKLEDLVKQLRKEVPDLATVIELDVGKTGSTTFHRIAIDPMPPDLAKIVGNSPILVGFTDEVVYFGLGGNTQKAIEEQVGKGLKAGPLVVADLHWARLAPMLASGDRTMLAAAKKAFDGKTGKDLFQMKIESGSKLTYKMTMKTQVLAFFSALAPK